VVARALKAAKEQVPDIRDAVLAHIEDAAGNEALEAPDTAPSSGPDPSDTEPQEDAWTADDVDWGDPFSSSG
jgi:hypothetical protein